MKRLLLIHPVPEFLEALRVLLQNRFAVVQAKPGDDLEAVWKADHPVDIVAAGVMGEEDFETVKRIASRGHPLLLIGKEDLLCRLAAGLEVERLGMIREHPLPDELHLAIDSLLEGPPVTKRKPARSAGDADRTHTKSPPRPELSQVHDAILTSGFFPRGIDAFIRRSASHAAPILLIGEYGTGRETLARMIHRFRPGSRGFTVLDGRISDLRQLRGELEKAESTLFVKYLEELDPASQEEMLVHLESVLRVKDSRFRGPRIIGSTTREIFQRVDRNRFSPALYYRLNISPAFLPPLRERKQDIPDLLEYVLSEGIRALELPQRKFSAQAVSALGNYYWPGNLLEFESVILRTVASSEKEVVEETDLRFASTSYMAQSRPTPESKAAGPAGETAPVSKTIDSGLFDLLITEFHHRMGNPLTSIKTLVQMMPEMDEDEDFIRGFRDVVGNDLARMEEFLNQLSEYTRLTTADPKPQPISEVVNDFVERLGSGGKSNASEVQPEVKEPRIQVLADESFLGLAMGNIARNTLSEIGNGDPLDLVVRRIPGGVNVKGAEESAEISITYQQTSSPPNASDWISGSLASNSINTLELSIADRVLQKMNGKLKVFNRSDGKKTISILLPAIVTGKED